MKKIILNTLICIVFVVLVAFVLYYYNGSLEMYPTEEQYGKARIVTGLFSLLLAIFDVYLVLLRIKIAKQLKK